MMMQPARANNSFVGKLARTPGTIRREREGYKPVMLPKAAIRLFGGMTMMNEDVQTAAPQRRSPIKNKVGSLFIPVTDIARSRDWYCRLLGLPEGGEILNSHLYPLPMEGTGIILDTMGKDGLKFFPLIATLFLFILFCNLIG